MKQIWKKVLSLLLVLSLLFLCVGVNVKVKAEDASSILTFEKVSSALDDYSGTYLIVYETGNVAFDGSLTSLDAASNTVEISITNNIIEGRYSNNTFIISKASDETTYYIQSKSGYYIGNTSNSNKLMSNETTKYLNTISYETDGIKIVSSGEAVLRYNSDANNLRFRYFKSTSYTNQKAVSLFKLTSIIEDTGQVSVTFNSNGGNNIDTKYVDKDSTVTAPTNPVRVGYNFVGWYSDETLNNLYDFESSVSDNITLYAKWEEASYKPLLEQETKGSLAVNYSIVQEEVQNVIWSLVSDVSSLNVDDKIIIVSSNKANEVITYYALGSQNKNKRKAIEILKNEDDTVKFDVIEPAILTLENGNSEGTWALKSTEGYLFAASSSDNYLKSEDSLSDNSSWDITISDCNATIKANGTNTKNILKYNAANELFSCYSSGQTEVQIYKQVVEEGSTIIEKAVISDNGLALRFGIVISKDLYEAVINDNLKFGVEFYQASTSVTEFDETKVLKYIGCTPVKSDVNGNYDENGEYYVFALVITGIPEASKDQKIAAAVCVYSGEENSKDTVLGHAAGCVWSVKTIAEKYLTDSLAPDHELVLKTLKG